MLTVKSDSAAVNAVNPVFWKMFLRVSIPMVQFARNCRKIQGGTQIEGQKEIAVTPIIIKHLPPFSPGVGKSPSFSEKALSNR